MTQYYMLRHRSQWKYTHNQKSSFQILIQGSLRPVMAYRLIRLRKADISLLNT